MASVLLHLARKNLTLAPFIALEKREMLSKKGTHMNQNYLFFAVDTHVAYSFRMAHLSELVRDICTRHELNPARSHLLGTAILGCVLMSSLLDDEEAINVRIQCGAHFTIGVECNELGHVKGYLEANQDSDVVQKIDQEMEWEENLMVRSVRTQKNRTQLFEGVTALVTNSIEAALNDHLASSYQMATRLNLQHWTTTAGLPEAFGFILQELPNISKELSQTLTEHMGKLPSMHELYQTTKGDPDLLAQRLIPGPFTALKSLTPSFRCSCSQKKVSDAVGMLPMNELEEMIHKADPVEVRCHYCNTKHQVDLLQLKEIYQKQCAVPLLN